MGAFVALTSCGLAPAYGPDGVGEQWQNAVSFDTPQSVIGYRMNARLTEIFGLATAAKFTVKVEPQVGSVSATITEDGDSTRYNLTGNAAWTLTDLSGVQTATGLEQTFTSYSATGSTVATQAAENDAQARLGVALADLIARRVVLLGAAQ